MDKTLTPKQEKFCQEVAAGKTLSDAYRSAYSATKMKPETVNKRASEKMAIGEIKGRVKELTEMAANAAMMTSVDVLKEGMRLASFDIRKLYKEDGSPIPIHELDDNTARCLQGVEIEEQYENVGGQRVFVGYTRKYKVADKNAALEKLFKHFGLYERDNEQKTNPLSELLKELSGSVVKPGKPLNFPELDDEDEH